MQRKGQSAMEYLMTYGWAILVVMVVGIVMWQLGIFNMGGTSVTSTGFAKLKPQLGATGISATSGVNAIFTNGAGTSIWMNAATGTVSSSGTAVCGLYQKAGSAVTISAGDNFALTGPCAAAIGSAGDIYTVDVAISYDASIGGIQTRHVESGTLRGPLEA